MKKSKMMMIKKAAKAGSLTFLIFILGFSTLARAYPLDKELESVYDKRGGTFVEFTYYGKEFSEEMAGENFSPDSNSSLQQIYERLDPEAFHPARWVQEQSNRGWITFKKETTGDPDLVTGDSDPANEPIVLREGPAAGSAVLATVESITEDHKMLPVLDEINDYLYIQSDTLEGWVHKDRVSRQGSMEELSLNTIRIRAKVLNFRQEPSLSGEILGRVGAGEVYSLLEVQEDWVKILKDHQIGWVHRAYTEEHRAKIPEEMYQFMQLATGMPSGILEEEIQQLFHRLSPGKDVPEEIGKALLEAGEVTGLNEVYLAALVLNNYKEAQVELYEGILVDEVGGSPVEPKTVYNFFSIGASDRAPVSSAAETAYDKEWFTAEKAILEGAQWILEHRIHGTEALEREEDGRLDTLHKLIVASYLEREADTLLQGESLTNNEALVLEIQGFLEEELREHQEIRGWIKDIYEEFELENQRFHIPVFDKTWYWPLPGYQRLSSDFGYRRDPFEGDLRWHRGIDIPAPVGTPVIAVQSGVVIKSFRGESYGNWLEIDHGGGLTTRYAHNNEKLVSLGSYVNKGDLIARIGSTGRSTGPHLHFEIRLNNQAVDPLPWFLEPDRGSGSVTE